MRKRRAVRWVYRIIYTTRIVPIQRGHPEYNRRVDLASATAINDFKREAAAQGLPAWLTEYRIEEIKEAYEWEFHVKYQNVSRAPRLQRILDTAIRAYREQAAADKLLPWEIEYEVAEITENFQWWKLGVKDQNVPREPRLQKLLDNKIQLFREYASAENWLPWQIEYSIAVLTEDFQWWKLGVKDQNIPREPRLQKLAELKQRLEREYNERAAQELAKKVNDFRAKATAEKRSEWEIEYEIEAIEEDLEWQYYIQYEGVSRLPRLQELLETKIQLFREYANDEDWPAWEIEYSVKTIEEEHEWVYYAQYKNIPRSERLQKLLETGIELFRTQATAEKRTAWTIEYEVESFKEEFEWTKLGHQTEPREQRLQRLLETKIRLFRAAAIAEKRPNWVIESDVEVLKEDFEWWRLEQQTEPRQQRLQRVLDNKIRLFREHAAAQKWLLWETEYEVAKLIEDFQWQKLGVKDQNISREPRLQGLLETKIRLFKEHAIVENWLPWQIEYSIAVLTEDFQWWKLGVKDQNIPRAPRLQKLRELKARLEQEYNEQIALELAQIQTQKIQVEREADAKIVQFFSEAATDAVTEYLETFRKEKAERELSKGFNVGIAGGSVNFDQSLEYNTGAFAGRALYEIAETIDQSQVNSYPLPGPAKQAPQSPIPSAPIIDRPTDSQRADSAVSAGIGAVPIGAVTKADAPAGKTAVKEVSTVPADKTTDGLAKGSATDRKLTLPKEHPYAIWAAAKEWFGNLGSETAAPAASTVPAGETTNALAKESDRKPALPKEHPYAIWAAAKEWFGNLGSETAAPAASTVPADKTTDGLANRSATDRKLALPKEHPYAIWAAVKEWFGSLGSETAIKAISSAGVAAGEVGAPALDTARETQRQVIARDFYRSTTGWDDARIAAHLRGIDFSQPVSVVNIPPGTSLVQFNLPGRTGNYFAPVGTPANKLGIYTSGLIESRYTFEASTPALRSTAASVVDDWSMGGAEWQIQTSGGETQYFIPKH